jgi:hypothetical protein
MKELLLLLLIIIINLKLYLLLHCMRRLFDGVGDGVRARFPESGKKKKTDLRDMHNEQALDGVLSKENQHYHDFQQFR